jgi:hypothetical protein
MDIIRTVEAFKAFLILTGVNLIQTVLLKPETLYETCCLAPPKSKSNIEQGISNVEGNRLPGMINHPSLPNQQSGGQIRFQVSVLS